MNNFTQPMTDAERAKVREWAQMNAINSGQEPQGYIPSIGIGYPPWMLSEIHPRAEDVFANTLSEPVEFDYLALNREFSE